MKRIAFCLTVAMATTGYVAGACSEPACLVEKPADYHTHVAAMSELLAQNKELIDAQGLEVFDEKMYPIIDGDEENCRQITEIKTPYAIQTKFNDSSTHKIVQLHNYQQKIKWTTCYDNDPVRSCFGSVFTSGVSGRGGGVRTACGVKYGAVSLYVFAPQYDELRYTMYEVPVACGCTFQRTYD